MARFAKPLVFYLLYSISGCRATCSTNPGNNGFDHIDPSTNITWTPCFDGFTCSRLTVPLDYSNTDLGTTDIAFIKLAGKNATATSPNIVFIPGGPGGSGVDLILSNRERVGQAFGEQYNVISYDPRGVNNSGPHLDCFSGNPEARLATNRVHKTGTTNTSSTSLEEQFSSSSIWGQWCNDAVERESPYGYYVTTPAVARDLLAFTEAQAEANGQSPEDAKLWAYSASYGTVVGQTFASMFPDRVGRMVLDGVMNADQYYDNNWRDNVLSMDETMADFTKTCHSAGPDLCPFWGRSAEEITAKMDAIIENLLNQPIPVSGIETQSLPYLVTYADLKTLFMTSMYMPMTSFPTMADVLHQLEGGNATVLVGMVESGLLRTQDSGLVIRCIDSYRRNKLNTIEDFKGYVEDMVAESKYLGDIVPIFLETIMCRGFEPELPDSMMFNGSVGTQEPTFFPMLFTSNTVDGLSPLKSAQEAIGRFPGSQLLVQEATGHTVVDIGGSICYFTHIQMYFHGILPPANTTCAEEFVPFIGPV